MTVDHAARIAELEAESRELVFPSFDSADAWRLGCILTERALDEGLGVAIDIRRPGLILFRTALAGTTADNEYWIGGKSAAVLRLESSSLLLASKFAEYGIDPASTGWLPAADYTVAGGSVPVRVAGVGVVAAVTVSGLSSEQDHALVVDAMRAFLTDGEVDA
jgi:uncharacterized protein (UPF0303 family)